MLAKILAKIVTGTVTLFKLSQVAAENIMFFFVFSVSVTCSKFVLQFNVIIIIFFDKKQSCAHTLHTNCRY